MCRRQRQIFKRPVQRPGQSFFPIIIIPLTTVRFETSHQNPTRAGHLVLPFVDGGVDLSFLEGKHEIEDIRPVSFYAQSMMTLFVPVLSTYCGRKLL
jgi:hypothetical protein